MFVALLYVVFGIELLAVLMFLLSMFGSRRNKKQQSAFATYFIKISSIFALLLVTIGIIPFYEIFFVALYCREDDNVHGSLGCYSGIYWLHLAVGIVGLVILILMTLLLIFLFVDTNPNSPLAFAAPHSKLSLLRFILKVALPFYFTFDYTV